MPEPIRPKIKTAADLEAIRQVICKQSVKLDQKAGTNPAAYQISVCTGGSCLASGSLKVKQALEKEIQKAGLSSSVTIKKTGCLGPCVKGPVIIINPGEVFYQNVKVEDATLIVKQHIINGQLIEHLLYQTEKEGKKIPELKEIDFFKKQTKLVLHNCGEIDPESIEEFIAHNGYKALSKALTEMTPDQVIEEVKQSGLRGRGGAGFPAWLKWSLAKKETGKTKYMLCNADEGDPGAFMDRSLLEGDPHSIIEGMAIGAFAIGASLGVVYVRAEYPLAVERLKLAIERAHAFGLLGDNIFNTGFNFDLEIRMGSGAFVCGEETALIASIEGKRGEPRPRPPFPAQKGLWDEPSVLNNVETYANIPSIILNGGSWLAAYGTAKSKGTKVFALAGTIKNAGLVEVPIGTTLGELIFDIGGGIPNDRDYKAAQIGGPSGGCIPKQHLNVSLDYEALNELGAIMGSGGLVVMDENTCMVDVARFFLEFVQEESCGKCSPCRVGSKRMLEILERICAGHGEEGDVERLIKLGEIIKDTSLCGLGQTAPNPVLSTIRYFRHEYDAHIRDKHCDAGICSGLVRAPCQSGCPAKVDVPGFVSLVNEQRYDEALIRHRERNPFAAVCARVCFHPCESKCRRSSLDEPVSVRAIKRFMVDHSDLSLVPRVMQDETNAQRKVAIIGAGPAGLSCAYFLARLGYKPEVFEAENKAGGMLASTIPAYRLPRKILNEEIKLIEELGVKIRYNQKLGRDFSLKRLKEKGYDAVFLGIGAQQAVKAGIPGENATGVVDGLQFLSEYNLSGKTQVGRKVAVIGGGNAAIDAARTALRLGASEVQVLYRRTREEMPAYKEELAEAEKEGIIIKVLTAPYEIVTNNQRVSGVKCHTMQLGGYDSTGRKRPVVKEGADVLIPVDQVILAIGQKVMVVDLQDNLTAETPDPGQVTGRDNAEIKIELQAISTIYADQKTGQTSVPWVFAGGDVVTGPSSVVAAIAAGEKAAYGIDLYLTNETHAFWREELAIDTTFDPDADPVMSARAELAFLDLNKRRQNFNEVEVCFTKNIATEQASRCLRCDFGKNPKSKNN